MPGTPSMSLRSATPCQCTLVEAGSRLSTSTRIRSPARARISGPGAASVYPQVRTSGPRRSGGTGRAVRVVVVTAPVRCRAASTRPTSSESGGTRAGSAANSLPAQAAAPAAPASPTVPAIPARTLRRVMAGGIVVAPSGKVSADLVKQVGRGEIHRRVLAVPALDALAVDEHEAVARQAF